MRVISGQYRGRKLEAAPSSRPTTDRVKEALFSTLHSMLQFEGIQVLDLFAGSGALGLEALSRGAEFATLVEKDLKAVNAIKQNISKLTIDTQSFDIKAVSVDNFLKQAPKAYDLIFADPPYERVDFVDLLDSLYKNGFTHENTFLVYESASDTPLDLPSPYPFKMIKEKSYGTSTIRILKGNTT